LSSEDFLTQRKDEAGVVLVAFKQWLTKRYADVNPELLLGKAVGYTLNQWEKLIAYLESPYLTPDNNLNENAIRPWVTGRKNWLFYKSPDGARSACGIYSLIETAKLNGLVPSPYLTHVFEHTPLAASLADWEALLPWNVKC
jgi:transposase